MQKIGKMFYSILLFYKLIIIVLLLVFMFFCFDSKTVPKLGRLLPQNRTTYNSCVIYFNLLIATFGLYCISIATFPRQLLNQDVYLESVSTV